MLDFSNAQYVCAAHKPSQWPDDIGAEVAFVGRSNVGKSSALNSITNRKGLAKTSKTPGRTQQLVFFDVTANQRLVDLPGYGFAKTPLSVRQHWENTISRYLQTRRSLRGVMLPMDIRRPFTDLDTQMVAWLTALHLPFHILLTKADKLSRGKAESVRLQVERKLVAGDPDAGFVAQPGGQANIQSSVQIFSAPKRAGLDIARQTLDNWLADPEVEKRLL